MTLDIKAEASKLRTMYASNPRSKTTSFLIYGGMGSGKTYSLKTARKPVLIHSFDPGGTDVLEEELKNGNVIADIRFEVEDPKNPTSFAAWDAEYHRLKRIGFFDHAGTFVIDSITTWAQAALNAVLKKAGRPGGVPQQNDWYPQMVMLENAIKDILALPCDVIMIGHDASIKDEVTGKIQKDLLITGKLVRRIPLLFGEIYHAEARESSKGVAYTFLTRKNDTYQARSRLDHKSLLELHEKPDYKYILKKTGHETDDKPLMLED